MITKLRALRKILFHKTINFARQTTIHGVPHIVAPRVHTAERTFWIIILIMATGGAIAVALKNLGRFVENPTVVTLQKDFRNWYNTFPSATGCFIVKADEIFIDNFIEETFGINDTDSKYDYYREFILAVANVSYYTLDQFEPFKNDETLNKLNFLQVAAKVHPELTGTLVTFDPSQKTTWKLVMTEMGICFAVNTKIAKHFAIKFEDQNNGSKENENSDAILACHYLNGLCYARYDSDPEAPLKVYVHSYLDILHATSEHPLYVRESQELEINFQMQETYSGSNLRYLLPSQRRCRFDDEPMHKYIPAYSNSICFITCRYKLTMKLCGCRPFFYHNFPGKICDIKGLLCVAKHVEYITSSPLKLGCVCPEPCDFISYIPQVPKITIWEYGYFDQRITFRWGLLPPTTKFHRDIIFGFENLVVSIGGTVAFFLGISFITGIEIIFFIVELLFYVLYPHQKRRESSPGLEKKAFNMGLEKKYNKKKLQQHNYLKQVRVLNSREMCKDCMMFLNVNNKPAGVIYPICRLHMSYKKKANAFIIPYHD